MHLGEIPPAYHRNIPASHRPRSSRSHRAIWSLVAAAVLVAGGIAGIAEVRDKDLPVPVAGSTPSPSSSAPAAAPKRRILAIAPAGFRLTAPIQRTVAVANGAVVYLAGGLDAAGASVDGVFSLEPGSGKLTSLGHLARAVHDAAGAMIDGKLFVFAGGTGTGTDTVQAFDPATGRGTVVGHLPVALSDLASATVGGTTYLIGGYDGIRPRPEIYATTDGTTFATVGRLPQGLRYPAVTVAGGKIVIAGGLSAAGPTADVYVFDPASGRVRTLGHLHAPVAHAAAFALGGVVYVAGGRNAGDTPVRGVSSIDPSTGTIGIDPPLAGSLADAGVASTTNGTLLIGGEGATTLDQILRAALRTAPTRAQHSATPSTTKNVYAAIATGTFSPKVTGDPRYVYVPNGIPGTVEVIDPATYRIVRTIHLGFSAFPEHVTPSWDLRWLYVDVDASSELAVIDPRTGRLVRIIHGVPHPYNLYFSPDGSKAIDVAEYYNQLDFMNPHTWKLLKRVPMPCRGPDHLDFSANGSFLLIGCEYDGTVVKVNVAAMKVVHTIHVGGLPVDVKLAPDGSVFYVANQGLSGVSVIDAASLKVVQFIPTGRGAHGMAISRDTTKLYVTNRLAGTISVIDFATRKVIHTWRVGGSPDMVQVTPDGTKLWISNRYGTTVETVSTLDGHVIHRVQVGLDPHGLSFFPQPGRFSLGHNGVYR